MDFKQAARLHDTTLENQRQALLTLNDRLDYIERVYGGHVIWKIDDFSVKMVEAIKGTKPTVYSPPFYTSRYGYKIIVSICPNGQGPGESSVTWGFYLLIAEHGLSQWEKTLLM